MANRIVARKQNEYIKNKIEKNKVEKNKEREDELIQMKEKLSLLLVMPALVRNWNKPKIVVNLGLYIPVLEVRADRIGIFDILFYDNGTIGFSPRLKYLKKKTSKMKNYIHSGEVLICKDEDEIYELVNQIFI